MLQYRCCFDVEGSDNLLLDVVQIRLGGLPTLCHRCARISQRSGLQTADN